MSLLLLFQPAGYTPTPKKLVAEGDSLTQAGASWPSIYSSARSASGYTVVNVATGGQGLSDVMASINTQIYGNTPETVGIFLQANDLSGPDDGATVAENILSQFVDPLRASGIKVVGFTSLPQAAPAGNPSIHNPRRAAFDSAMRTAYSTGRLDGLADVSADPIIGVTAAASDSALYTDGIHMTAYGYSRVGTIAIPAIDEAFNYPSDTTPAAYTVPQTYANASTVSYSTYIKPTGFDTPTPISVTGGAEIEINDSGYWATADLLPINGFFRLRRTSASSASTLTSTVSVGGITADWNLITVNGTLWTLAGLPTAPVNLFDLRNRATVTVSSGNVTGLQDQGSGGNNATGGSGGPPTFALPSNVNGYPGIRVLSGTAHLIFSKSSIPSDYTYLRHQTNVNTIRLSLGVDSYDAAGFNAQTAPYINIWTWTAGSGNAVVTAYQNGAQVQQWTGQTRTNAGSIVIVGRKVSGTGSIMHPTGTANIGVLNRTDGSDPYNGDISAWAFFNYALSQSDREKIEGHWGHGFNLTLASGHTYETTPPVIGGASRLPYGYTFIIS